MPASIVTGFKKCGNADVVNVTIDFSFPVRKLILFTPVNTFLNSQIFTFTGSVIDFGAVKSQVSKDCFRSGVIKQTIFYNACKFFTAHTKGGIDQ